MPDHLAIVLPGRGYGPLGPALRLPRLAVEQTGAEVADVSYPSIPADHDQRAWESFHRAVADGVTSLLLASAPTRITFIAKSLGTIVLASLPAEVPIPGSVRAIWLTPIFGVETVRSGVIAQGWRSLLVAGEADSAHNNEHHNAVASAIGASSLVLPRADHLLEVPGDVLATLDGFRALTEAVIDFSQ